MSSNQSIEFDSFPLWNWRTVSWFFWKCHGKVASIDVVVTKDMLDVSFPFVIFLIKIVNGIYFTWMINREPLQRSRIRIHLRQPQYVYDTASGWGGFCILPILCRDAWLVTGISQKFGQEFPFRPLVVLLEKSKKQNKRRKKVSVKVCPNFWCVPKQFPPEIPSIRLMACKSATPRDSPPPLVFYSVLG